MRYQRLSVCVLATLAGCMMGMTQPDPSERSSDEAVRSVADREPAPGRLGLEIKLDPEALRIRLERMVQRGQEMAERGQSALDKLDAGASAKDVLNELRPDQSAQDRPDREPRPQARREQPGKPKSPGSVQEDRSAMYAFLRDEFPELWENLSPIIQQDPSNAERLLGRMAPQIREILVLKRSHPELASIKTSQMRAGFDFVEAARIYRTVLADPDAGNDQIEQASDEMRKHAEARFDAELRAKQLEIAKLEERLNQLRFSIDALEDQREGEVDRIVNAAKDNAVRLNTQQSQRKKRNKDRSESGDN